MSNEKLIAEARRFGRKGGRNREAPAVLVKKLAAALEQAEKIARAAYAKGVGEAAQEVETVGAVMRLVNSSIYADKIRALLPDAEEEPGA